MKRSTTNLLLFLFLFSSIHAIGQTGSIKGNVKDAKSALVGAVIYLQSNKAKGTTSDINGDFLLTGIPAGSQEIAVRYLGYADQVVTVDVTAGEISELKISLEPLALEGDEVIITAQRRGQTQAINQQLASDKIANIVSSDRIQELPDVNAAEAIGRLPGIALNRSGGEGQKVVIRGLEPKFSAITVNGVRLPSNSSTDRSVDLSLIAPELLDAIEVFKSPLPDMDAEAIGGTVNLRIRKAPERPRVLAKVLGGYNDLAEQFQDYKGVLQASKRFFNNRLGVIAQGSIERFNRSGDFVTNNWRRGRTDSTGLTEILGNSLRIEDRSEIRKRLNGSLALDYEINKKHSLSVFGVYSRTDRDQFRLQETYDPNGPNIGYRGEGVETSLSLYSVTMSGDHNFLGGKVLVDWSLATSQSDTETPYNYYMNFSDTRNSFDPDLNRAGHPRTFLGGAEPNLEETNLVSGEFIGTSAFENTQTALVNIDIPFQLGEKIKVNFKFGGKYYGVERERDYNRLSENFYYLGGVFASNGANRYREAGGELTFLPSNGSLIGINSFFQKGDAPSSLNEAGESIPLSSNIDPALVRKWYEAQLPILNRNRFGIVNRYQVSESITAGYAMLKFKVGDVLTVIPGFRYEASDNAYTGGISRVNGRYGVNGTFEDTTTYQVYDEFLPHLHIKFKPTDWFDVRLSYAQTLARPDFAWLTPRIQIDDTNLRLNGGNPDLRYSKATNYDVHFSFYDKILGLFTIGAFYKEIENTFFPWTIFLADSAIAADNGLPGFNGYELTSYTNLDRAEVFGFEVDLQTNLSFLPKPFNGIVLNTNYSRMFSRTKAFFTTSETVLVNPFPPIFETTYTINEREVDLVSQSPHIFHFSLGYDFKKFSARISSIYQGTRATSYSLDEDFDRYTLEFWRWDASVKQGVGDNWNIFLNLNNLTNQQDISFTRDERFLNTIQTYGFTGTIGFQFTM